MAMLVAASALVALPSGASADHRVLSSACPYDLPLQGIERAPGGVVLVGRVVAVTPDVGRVQLAVDAWYHRSMVPGLAPGHHPPTVDVVLGPRLSLTGRVAVAHLPRVGSRFLVAGTWARTGQGISVACGIFANVNMPVGEGWLQRAEAHYLAMAPTVETARPGLPLDAPLFFLGLGATTLILAAMILGALAQAYDPAPAV